jgi:hypothetical protein
MDSGPGPLPSPLFHLLFDQLIMSAAAGKASVGFFTWIRNFSYERPVLAFSFGIGALGPLFVVVAPPFRRNVLGSKPVQPLPLNYPSELCGDECGLEGCAHADPNP